MSDWLELKDVCERLDHSHVNKTRAWVKRYEITFYDIDGDWLFDSDELAEELLEIEAGDRVAVRVVRDAKGRVERADRLFKPFCREPRLLEWNRGKYRGWAIAAMTATDSSWVDLITDYGRRYIWSQKQITDAIAAGEFFYHEPHEVLRFMAMQLMRVKEVDGMLECIKALHQLADRLEAIKTTTEGGDMHGTENKVDSQAVD